MNSEQAHKLFSEYVTGWIDGDCQRILNTLSDDCTIIESHGPTFEGIGQVERWISEWNERKSVVNQWVVQKRFFEDGHGAYQWTFECVDRDRPYHIEGTSIVSFDATRITRIVEYMRLTNEAKDDS